MMFRQPAPEDASGIPPPSEQESIVQDLTCAAQPAEGAICYLLATRWYNKWRAHTTSQGPDPGIINNNSIIVVGENAVRLQHALRAYTPELVDDAREPEHFVTVPETVWRQLHDWYGGGPALPRPMYLEGPAAGVTKLRVDTRGVRVVVHYGSKQKELASSWTASFTDFAKRCHEAFGIKDEAAMLPLYDNNVITVPYRRVAPENPSDPLYKVFAKAGHITSISIGEPKMVDKPQSSGNSGDEAAGPVSTRPSLFGTIKNSITRMAPASTFGRATGAFSGPQDTTSPAPGRVPGLAGLANLGNTCFMNSSLQCLSHTVPLLKVFLNDAYREDINVDNPLGCKGELAQAFGELLKKQWQGNVAMVNPRGFKARLGNFAPQFAGYQQQDSQELLAFLLDGLHEDLNRILKKPYIEEKDASSRPDEEVAKEAWQSYRARNDSVIVDHFQGLLKSTLVCPVCTNRSVKFDPYMYLSLPLPTAKSRVIRFVVMHMDGSALPRRCAVKVPKQGKIGDLYKAVAEHLDVGIAQSTAKVLLAEVDVQNNITVLDDMSRALSEIRNPIRSDEPHVVVYYYGTAAHGPSSEACQVLVFNRHTKSYTYPHTMAAPMVMYLKEDDLKAVRTQKVEANEYSSEYIVRDPGALAEIVETALRPFKRQKLNPEIEDMDTSQGVGVPVSAPCCSLAAAADMEDNKENEDSNTPPGTHRPAVSGRISLAGDVMDVEGPSPTASRGVQGAGLTERDISLANSHAAAVLLDGHGCKRRGVEDASSSDNAGVGSEQAGASCDSEVPDEPQDMTSSRVSLDKDDEAQGGASFAPPSPVAGPFGRANGHINTFHPAGSNFKSRAVELATDADCDGGEDDAAQAGPSDTAGDGTFEDVAEGLYTLRRSTVRGEVRLWYEFDHDYSKPVCFALDWQQRGTTEYDLDAMTHPEKDPSADLEQEDPTAKTVTLDQCLQAFTTSEQLDESDSWYCNKCKEHVRADKKLDLWTTPEVLVVHLKRFSYSRLWRDKLDTLVDFPLEGLDLSQYLLHKPADGAAPVYDLYAVSNHYGGLGGGHYTAYCRMPDSGKWHTFDDGHVSSVDEETVKSSAAYVLFYRRRDQHIKEQGLRLQAIVPQPEDEEAEEEGNEAGPPPPPLPGGPILLGFHDVPQGRAACPASSSSSAATLPQGGAQQNDFAAVATGQLTEGAGPLQRAYEQEVPGVVEGFQAAAGIGKGGPVYQSSKLGGAEAMDLSYGPSAVVSSSSSDEPMSGGAVG